LNLGFIGYKTELFEEAEQEARKSIEINSKKASAYYLLCLVLNKLKRFEVAEQEGRKAIEIDPYKQHYYNALADALSGLGKELDAKEAFNIGLLLNRHNLLARDTKGNLIKEKFHKEVNKEKEFTKKAKNSGLKTGYFIIHK